MYLQSQSFLLLPLRCRSPSKSSCTEPKPAVTASALLQVPNQPDGFEFSIRTPVTPPRWADFDTELQAAWANILREMAKGACARARSLAHGPQAGPRAAPTSVQKLARAACASVLLGTDAAQECFCMHGAPPRCHHTRLLKLLARPCAPNCEAPMLWIEVSAGTMDKHTP